MGHKKIIKTTTLLFILLVILTIGPITALASDVTGADYYGIVVVTNNSTAATNVRALWSTNTTALIDTGFLDSGANYTAMRNSSGADVAYMPAREGVTDWFVWITSIGGYASQSYTLYTADTDMSADQYYFPGTGGMATVDDSNLEPGDNFTISQQGWIDTDNATGKNLVLKESAVRTFVEPTASGNITSQIIATTTLNTLPNAAGDMCLISAELGAACPNHWQNVDDPVGTPDDGVSYVQSSITPPEQDSYNVQVPTYAGRVVQINSITVFFRWWADGTGGGDGLIRPVLRLNGVNTLGTQLTEDTSTWVNANETLARPGGGEWTEADIVALQTSIFLGHQTGGIGRCTQVYLIVNYDYAVAEVQATGVSSGERTVTTEQSSSSDIWATGNILHLNGTATSVISASTTYNSSPKLWLSFLFMLDSNFSGGSNQRMFGKRIDANNRLHIYLSTSGTLVFEHNSGGDTKFTLVAEDSAGSPITNWVAGQWYSVIASTSNTTGARFRVDDGQVQTNADTTAVPNGGTFTIGHQSLAGNDGLKGFIQNFIAGTDDLTGSEETGLLNGIEPGDETDYWFIDEGTGTAITSYGTGANAATAGGSTSWQTATHTGTDRTGRYTSFAAGIDSINTGHNDTFKGTVSVVDNANDWVFIENGSIPYLLEQTIEINGVQQQRIRWEYTTGDFTDLSGNSHDGTPTYPTTSSDADITAELTEFAPISPARAPAYAVDDPPAFITSTPTITGDFTTSVNSTLPGASVIDDVSTAGSTPNQLPWGILACFGTVVSSLTVSWFQKKTGNRSLIPKIAVLIFGIGILVATMTWGWWYLLFFLIIAVALAIASRQRGW